MESIHHILVNTGARELFEIKDLDEHELTAFATRLDAETSFQFKGFNITCRRDEGGAIVYVDIGVMSIAAIGNAYSSDGSRRIQVALAKLAEMHRVPFHFDQPSELPWSATIVTTHIEHISRDFLSWRVNKLISLALTRTPRFHDSEQLKATGA